MGCLQRPQRSAEVPYSAVPNCGVGLSWSVMAGNNTTEIIKRAVIPSHGFALIFTDKSSEFADFKIAKNYP
jgi:hypothetical protein